MEPHPLGDGRAREIGILDNIVDPLGLAALQHASDEVDAGKKNRFAAGFFELLKFVGRLMPTAFDMQGIRFRIHAPQLPKLKADGFADVLKEFRRRFRKGRRFSERARHGKLCSQTPISNVVTIFQFGH